MIAAVVRLQAVFRGQGARRVAASRRARREEEREIARMMNLGGEVRYKVMSCHVTGDPKDPTGNVCGGMLLYMHPPLL